MASFSKEGVSSPNPAGKFCCSQADNQTAPFNWHLGAQRVPPKKKHHRNVKGSFQASCSAYGGMAFLLDWAVVIGFFSLR